MSRVAAVCLVLVALVGALVGGFAAPRAHAATASPSAAAQWPCGLPEQQPLWVDFADGSVPFWSSVFARPGVVGAAANLIVPPQLRAAGAKTVFFDLNFHVRMGSPSKPVDPRTIQSRADTLFAAAVKSSGCDTPVMALNELAGGQTPTPWTPTIQQYRANVLAFAQRLAERGARPVLLVANNPFTGEPTADDWWRQVAQVSDLVLEVYLSGPSLSNQGAEAASRRLRSTLRTRISTLTALGIPPSRLGVMLTFSSTPGAGGRNGLQPLSAWLDVVKWETVAAKAIAAETQIASVWSWGWGTWNAAGNDPDKAIAACVWLWTRAPSLCDAPTAAAGRGFDTSLQIGKTLPAGALCLLDDTPLRTADVDALTRVTGDRDIAYSAALQRLVLTETVKVSTADVLAAERDVILDRFRGGRAFYTAALQRAGATLGASRAILADELRRSAVESKLRVAAPSARQVADFYSTYSGERALLVRADKPVSWLGNRRDGVAISGSAPGRLFRLTVGESVRADGVKLAALGDVAPLGAFPLALATPSIRDALVVQARDDAFRTWSSRRQNQALNRLACAKDELPQPAPVDVADWLPFLELD